MQAVGARAVDPGVALVATAHRDGSSGPTQDRVFVGTWSVVVLDGASQLAPTERDGGWLADVLGIELMRRLETDVDIDLTVALRDSIAVVASGFGLVPGSSPSTTVSIVRWSGTTVDSLVVGDSPVAVRLRDGSVHLVRDDRTRRVEAVPDAALHAVRAGWPASSVEVVLMVTDGAADGVDVYGTPRDWSAAIDMALDPQGFLDAVQAVEADDALGLVWPRERLHGDKAVARITFL